MRRTFHVLGLEINPFRAGHHYVPDIFGRSAYKLADIRKDEPFGTLAREAIDGGRTLLYFDRLHILYQALGNVVPRLHATETLTTLEVGVYKGGGSFFLASVANRSAPGRVRSFAVDTFAGHSEHDVPGTEGAHRSGENFTDTSVESVRRYLGRWPFITILPGRIQEFADRLKDERFHFVHLDVDIYAPTLYVLETYSKRLHPGGIIVVDDYGFETCPGVKQAVGEFMNGNREAFTLLELPSGQAFLQRMF